MARVSEEGRIVAARLVRALLAIVLAFGVLVSTAPSDVHASKGVWAAAESAAFAFVPSMHDTDVVAESGEPDGHCLAWSCDLNGLYAEQVMQASFVAIPLFWVPVGERGRSMRPAMEPDPPRTI